MGRQGKPWKRSDSGIWYAEVNGKQINLGRDKKKAQTKFNELQQAALEPTPVHSAITARELLDRYLLWIADNRAPSSHAVKKYFIQDFRDSLPESLPATSLHPPYVDSYFRSRPRIKSPSTRNNYITLLNAMFNWAVRYRLVSVNPLARMEKPTPRVRQDFIPADRFAELFEPMENRRAKINYAIAEEMRRKKSSMTLRQLAAEYGVCEDLVNKVCTNKIWTEPPKQNPSIDFLTVMLESGARAQEMFKTEAKHFDGEKLTFIIEDSKGRRRSRVVYLPERAREIVARLAAATPTGPIFLNSRGTPWNKNSINNLMCRLKVKMGMPSLCATTLRHSYAHWRLTQGQDAMTVAKLLGHRDTRMLSTRYGHLEGSKFLESEAKRLSMPIPAAQKGQAENAVQESTAESEQNAPAEPANASTDRELRVTA